MTYKLLLRASLFAAGAALVIGSLRSIFVAVPSIWAGDYLSYAAAARRFLEGRDIFAPFQLADPYLLGDAAFGKGFVYPPTSIWLAVPFSMFGDFTGFVVFTMLASTALGVSMYRIALHEGLDRGFALVFALLVLLSPPSIESLATGQANTLVAVGLALSWLYPRASGYVAVFGGLVKLFPLAGIAWAIRSRAPVLRPIAALAVALGLTSLFMGIDAWNEFVTATANGHSSQLGFPAPPRHFLEPIVGAPSATFLVVLLAGALTLAAIRIRNPYLALLVLSVAMILPAPDWYVHYLLIPLAGLAPWLAHEIARLVNGRNQLAAAAEATESGP